ncbi:uncharacterized protein N7477_009547 [Penicillium maclennaniae]|uniref:uncharacterized protein n=1 Tax=Penicillium maclennaniae TaxID=1343394 RepID=UPI002541C03D|nr:uncharacterized protein N7477_009547 [Penicillium maclennaniae]KAJ5661931.1 hypothetical protein N7477_009547 [Penicillium maclennaniae]
MAPWWCTASSTLLLSMGAVAWPYSTYTSMPFQPPTLEINQTGVSDPGYIFLGPRGGVQTAGQAALIYDNAGNLVYEGPEEVTANFRVQTLNGSDVITFWAGDMLSLGYGYGTVHILDNTYQEIHTITLTGPFVTPDNSTKDSYIDLHESHITPQNTLLVTAYNLTQQDLTSIGGNSSDWMLDSHFYEIDIYTNEILNSWSALEHQDKVGKDVGTQDAPYDAYHINAITTTNNGYFVSLRHMWSGYYLYRNGTVVWQVSGEDGGDFQQVGEAGFSWQHDMRVYNETDSGLVLNLFNNANTPNDEETPTTGVSLSIDLENMTVTGLRSLSDPSDPIQSVSQGSYQLLTETDGHVFMDYGSISKVKEYDGDGKVVFSAQFGEDNAVASYRGYRFPWVGTPFWKPSVVVQRTVEGATVFMSWNGATEYDNWVVYSATSNTSVTTQQLSSANRTGFETAVKVVARQGNTVLGSSEIITF